MNRSGASRRGALSDQLYLGVQGRVGKGATPRRRKPTDPFRWFDSSPEVIGYAVMLYVRYPLSLRNVEDLLHERGVEICHETVRHWWMRFGPIFAAEIGRKRVQAMHQ